MPRSELDVVVRFRSGAAAAEKPVYIYQRGTSTQVTVYAAETGSTTLTQPLTTDVNGRVAGWCDLGSYDVQTTVDGTTVTEAYEAIASADITASAPVGAELLVNKSTDTGLSSNSDTLYPTQRAVKTYADTKVASTSLGVANGVATLGSDAKITPSQMPAGAFVFQGTWNALTNNPTLSDGTGTQGHVYIITTSGTRDLGSGSVDWTAGNNAVHNGSIWQETGAAAAVTSVAGRTGDVVLTKSDVGLGNVTNVEQQPLDSDLTAIAALTTTAHGRGLLDDADAAASRASIGAVIGTDVQAYDAQLAAIAGLTPTAGSMARFTSATAAEVVTVTDFAKTLLDDASQSAAQSTLGIAGTTDVNVLRNDPINVRDSTYGATSGTGVSQAVATANTTAINNAINAAETAGGRVLIPAGHTFEVNGSLNVGANDVTILLEGNIKCTAPTALTTGVFVFDKGAGAQGQGGGIIGRGKIQCNRKARYAVLIDTWRNAVWKDFWVCDPYDGAGTAATSGTGIMVRNTRGTSANGLDCDSHLFDHVTMKNDVSLGSNTQLPMRFIVFDATQAGTFSNNRIVSDNTVRDCSSIGGMRPETAAGSDNGGVFFECINSSRNVFESNRCYSHQTSAGAGSTTIKMNYGYLIRSTGTGTGAWDSSGNIIRNSYIECTTPSGGDTPHDDWHFRHIMLKCESGTDTSIDYTRIEGLMQSVDAVTVATVTHAIRLEMSNSGTGNLRYCHYARPRNFIANTQTIRIGADCTSHYIETLGPGEATSVANSGGITNIVAPLAAANSIPSVASANALTLPASASDFCNVTGTTAITSIAATFIGHQVTLRFPSGLTVTDGSNLKLASNYVATAGDTITLTCDGTDWHENSRSGNI